MLDALAIVLDQPGRLDARRLALTPPAGGDVVVRTKWSGVSTGTERLLFSGRMPDFPGMGYPLVPGYETVGEIVDCEPQSGFGVGQFVFVPGARCFESARSLFGGAASLLITPASRLAAIPRALGEAGVLMALAATAYHARGDLVAGEGDLIVGHGALGRLLARLCVLAGGAPPTVWERDFARAGGGHGYDVLSPEDDPRRDYRRVFDVSGDPTILDTLIARLAPGGEIVLAGFYEKPLSFSFPPAFMREARLRVAAQWRPQDLEATARLVDEGRLSLDGLVTHRSNCGAAAVAYPTAFNNPSCLKMVLDWREAA